MILKKITEEDLGTTLQSLLKREGFGPPGPLPPPSAPATLLYEPLRQESC